MKKLFLTFIFGLAIFVASLFITAPKAEATLPPLACSNPCPWPISPSGLPTDVYNYLLNADTNKDSNGNLATPSYSNWISPQSNTTAMQVVVVNSGTKSVPLSFNTAAVIGWIKSGTYTLGYNEVIPNNGTSKPITPSNTINTSTNINPGNTTGLLYARQVGYFASSKVNFDFTTDNPGGFTSDYYEINIPYKGVNVFSNGVWQCVTGGQAIFANQNTWKDVCPTENRKFIVAVIVKVVTSADSVGALTCTTEGTGTQKENYFTGFAVDATNQPSPPRIALLEDGKDPVYIDANVKNPTTYNNLKASLPGMLSTTNYDFKINIGDYGYHDGNTHSLTAVLVTSVPPWFTLPNNSLNPNPFVFGGLYGSTPIPCGGGTVDQWMYPWLQTKGGDVIANGQVIGQNIQNDKVIYSGARREDSSEKEAEYLIISAVGGGYPFCSNNKYIPTNAVSQLTAIPTSWYCNNGSGYSVLNNYDLNAGSSGDAVVEGANKAFSLISDPACVTDNKNKDTFVNITVPANCNNRSAMYKLAGADLNSVSVNQGKVTIIVNGDLNINQNITYSPTTGINNPKDMPGLGIIVKGNIYIAPGVTRVDAILYAGGKIDTCGNNMNSQSCTNNLVVNGAMIGKQGFRFGRSYANTSNSPAELIQATPELWLYPPLGMDLKTSSGTSSTYSVDYSEYQPRVSQ